MTEEEIIDFQISSMTGHRPTWKMGSNHNAAKKDFAEFYTENNGKISGIIFGATSSKIRSFLLLTKKFLIFSFLVFLFIIAISSSITKTCSLKNAKQHENLIEGLKKTCRKYAKEKTGKKPITNINVIRI